MNKKKEKRKWNKKTSGKNIIIFPYLQLTVFLRFKIQCLHAEELESLIQTESVIASRGGGVMLINVRHEPCTVNIAHFRMYLVQCTVWA